MERFASEGVLVLPPDPSLTAWAHAARRALETRLAAANGSEWRHGGTWFAGVDALDNAADGSVDGAPLVGGVLDLLAELRLLPDQWHKAQLSVVRPGYPRADPTESAGAIRFRRTRDAAHVDGLLPIGPTRRRMLRQPHSVILGIALTEADAGASPLVVWPGSHRPIGEALGRALTAQDSSMWSETDLTDTYITLRREVFDAFQRRPVPLQPGAAVLLHRHLLHGIAPWSDGATSAPIGRATAYFRPLLGNVMDWLPS